MGTSNSVDRSPVWARLLRTEAFGHTPPGEYQKSDRISERGFMKAFKQNEEKERALEHQTSYLKAFAFKGIRTG